MTVTVDITGHGVADWVADHLGNLVLSVVPVSAHVVRVTCQSEDVEAIADRCIKANRSFYVGGA